MEKVANVQLSRFFTTHSAFPPRLYFFLSLFDLDKNVTSGHGHTTYFVLYSVFP